MNNIERINDKEFRAEYTEKNQNPGSASKILGYIPTVLSLLILLALSSISTLFQFNFSLHSVAWTTFGLSLTLRFCYNFIARYGSANLRYQLSLNSENVKRSAEQCAAATEKIDISDFAVWLQNRNVESKKSKYKEFVQAEIDKINNRIYFLKYKLSKKFSERINHKIERLEFKLKEYQSKINPEYLDEHIAYIKVKYTPLRVSDFFNTSGKSLGKGEKYFIDEGKEISRECFKGIPSTLILTILGSLIGINITLGSVNIVSILFDVLAVSINFFNGYWIIGNKSVSSLLSVYTARRLLIAEYLNNK